MHITLLCDPVSIRWCLSEPLAKERHLSSFQGSGSDESQSTTWIIFYRTICISPTRESNALSHHAEPEATEIAAGVQC